MELSTVILSCHHQYPKEEIPVQQYINPRKQYSGNDDNRLYSVAIIYLMIKEDGISGNDILKYKNQQSRT